MAASAPLSMRVLFKFILPFMGIVMTAVLLVDNNQKTWALLPILLIALYVSAADIRIEESHAYYRRFVSWKKLPDDVIDIRCSFLPALGYVVFSHFVPPFGFLFFIVERDSQKFVPFRRTAFMRRLLPPPHQNETRLRSDNDVKRHNNNEKAGLAMAVYSSAGLLAGILIPVPWQHLAAPENRSFLSNLLQLQQNQPVLCLYAVVLAVFAIRNRSHGSVSFVLTFLIGTIVAHLTHLH